jgi:hypothetical protein
MYREIAQFICHNIEVGQDMADDLAEVITADVTQDIAEDIANNAEEAVRFMADLGGRLRVSGIVQEDINNIDVPPQSPST